MSGMWNACGKEIRNMKGRLEPNRHDMLIGVYWMPGHIYMCSLPCIAIHIWSDGA